MPSVTNLYLNFKYFYWQQYFDMFSVLFENDNVENTWRKINLFFHRTQSIKP